MRARLAAFVAATSFACVSAVASAEPMDPALERLAVDDSCHPNGEWAGDATGATVSRPCRADDASFKRLISQYAFAFAPTAMHSARTTGYGGFHLSLQADYTSISSDKDYWKKGTRGSVDPSSGASSKLNGSPSGMLQLYSLQFRKSFGFGFEVAGLVGFMPKTSIVSGGADVRFSILEGFRTGIGGVLPDVAVGGGVRTITGTPQFQITIASLDAVVSKPLPLQDSMVLTPYLGYQYLWIFGDSGLIDLTPGTDALRYCNYAGQNVPGVSTDNGPNTGQPICKGGSPLDFNNNVVFKPARLERHRLLFGLNYRYEMVMVGGQFLVDAVPPADAQNDDADKKILEGESRQYTLSFQLGAMF
ncbi:MAG: hypothetical protein EOO73_12525 [Myxococcales bacterium]|nr:MAG: hypothetical protein EOO73_12525 [Myxococcales bacterium]